MIIGFVGNIGMGKTVSMTADLIQRQPVRAYTNFKLYNTENYSRMKLNHIIEQDEDEKSKKWHINFDYWQKQINKHKEFNIYIDELNILCNSRTGQSNVNKAFNLWTAQIRKILQGSNTSNFVFSTQRPMAIDVGVRDLVHRWILCEKITIPRLVKTELYNGKTLKLPVSAIKRYVFTNLQHLMDYLNGDKTRIKKQQQLKPLIANKYYKYYNTFELVNFGNEYL